MLRPKLGALVPANQHLSTFFLQLAGRLTKKIKTLFLGKAPTNAHAFLRISVLSPGHNCCSTSSRHRVKEATHLLFLFKLTPSANLFPLAMGIGLPHCKQLLRSVPKARLSRCWKCVTQYNIYK